MPIYEFRCKKCNEQIEVFQKHSDKPPTRCRKCGGRMEKQFFRTSVQIKGEGWYVTDYCGRNGGVVATAGKGSSAPPTATPDKAKPKKGSRPTTRSINNLNSPGAV